MPRLLTGCIALGVAAAILSLTACDDIARQFGYVPAKSAVSTQKRPSAPPTPIHRFAVLQHDYGVAFDSQTGQVCRTWDWSVLGKSAKPDAEGALPQRQFGEFAPTCVSLYRDYPSVGSRTADSEADEEIIKALRESNERTKDQ
jgi:hypothetical protein